MRVISAGRPRLRTPGVLLSAALITLGFAATVAGKTIVRLDGQDRAVYDSLADAAIDPDRCFAVKPGSEWVTPLGLYHFSSGTLACLRPVAGHPTGCLFTGKGTLTFAPSSHIERAQLQRFCRDSILTGEFATVYFRFFDTAVAGGLYACLGEPAAGRPCAGDAPRAHDQIANDDLMIDLATHGWQLIGSDTPNESFLYCSPELEGQNRLHFLWDETADEAIQVWRSPERTFRPVAKGTVDCVCSYDRERPAAGQMHRVGLLHGGFDIERVESEVRISPSVVATLDVRLSIRHRRPEPRFYRLLIAPRLEIDTAWVNGAAAPFIYSEDGGWVVVRSPSVSTDDSAVVRLFYRGEHLLYKFPWGDFSIAHTTRWLPENRPLHRSLYHTTFRFPKHYDIVSSGRRVRDTIDGDWWVSEWETYQPELFVSFNYGSFDRTYVHAEGGPQIEIYQSRAHPGGLFAGSVGKGVIAHVRGALDLFSRRFGPYPWPRLAATEIPAAHGEGFPQLLHLAWQSFESTQKGVTEAFIAHEVAHQWFGHLVGAETYHSQWLAEGFAEYAGAMYVEVQPYGRQKLPEVLKEWRRLILEVGGHDRWHAGPYVAPIWLGFRCASESSPASYDHLVYAKGAYVLHMLRYLMQDVATGSDERFFALLRDYVGRYSHTSASTADFQQVVEEHMGQPMQWFFDQWVYGVQIPRFEYRWERAPTTDGRWIVRGQIDQFDVDSTFRTVMPISVAFDGDRWTFPQEVRGSRATFETHPFGRKPKDVLFNDGMIVLCREKVVGHP